MDNRDRNETNLCKPRCQFWHYICSGSTIIEFDSVIHNIRGSFTCSFVNLIYATSCQQCPSTLFIGQTGQSLCKRTNRHKSDIRNNNTRKPVLEDFHSPGLCVKRSASNCGRESYKMRWGERETAEIRNICKFHSTSKWLNIDQGFLAHHS